MQRISSGSKDIDEFLGGGYLNGEVNMIYGPATSGKTTFCLMTALHFAKDKKVLYIDTKNSFSVERVKQINGDESLLDNIIVKRVDSFDEQEKLIGELPNIVKNKIKLVILDVLDMHYRFVLRDEEVKLVNARMAQQLVNLTRLARNNNILVLVTNGVYEDLKERKATMIGGKMVRNWPKLLIQLRQNEQKEAVLEKDENFESEKIISFKLVNEGIEVL
ncbi:MAG: AAA family ATPase [Nanoarchaeota archaeon]